MSPLKIGIIGLGNVGRGTLRILADNASLIEHKLGFALEVAAICSRSILSAPPPEAEAFPKAKRTADWHEVTANSGIQIVVELVGSTATATEVIEASIEHGKWVVTANKELMAVCGNELWRKAAAHKVGLAMEASVAGGIPIHSVLREGISGDRIEKLIGILNGTCNYILTEMEQRGEPLDTILAEAQKLGYAEADPTADVDGYDARSKLALLSALAFGSHVAPTDIYVEGIQRIRPIDFAYAHRLGHTVRLIASAERSSDGLLLSVRPVLVPQNTILAHVQGSYNAIWVSGVYGADTFYYGRGAGPTPTGVAVVSDLMRLAHEIRNQGDKQISPFAYSELKSHQLVSIEKQIRPHYLRFRVKDRPGIIAELGSVLASADISLDAVLQEPSCKKQDLPFVITLEPTPEGAVRQAVQKMNTLDFMVEPTLALPLEAGLEKDS